MERRWKERQRRPSFPVHASMVSVHAQAQQSQRVVRIIAGSERRERKKRRTQRRKEDKKKARRRRGERGVGRRDGG